MGDQIIVSLALVLVCGNDDVIVIQSIPRSDLRIAERGIRDG